MLRTAGRLFAVTAATAAAAAALQGTALAGGQASVYDIWVNGYKTAFAAPDYVFDQAHGYSVCDTPAAAGCTDTPVAAPVITRTPVA